MNASTLRGVALALAIVGSTALAATAADTALEQRVQLLAEQLRCLVCQNQSLADSHAPLAVDLKNQVREQLRAGRADDEVIAFMTQRYGDFVRYRPPFKASTALLWLAAGWRIVRRQARAPQEDEGATSR